MLIDRYKWRPQWDEGDYPSLPCPTCGGPLNFDEDSLVVQTSGHNRELVELTDAGAALSRFSAWFVCGNSKCGEAVAISGNCTYQYAYDNFGATISERKFHPTAMHPSPPVIATDDDVPQPIRAALTESFGLFWINKEACASRLRVVLEIILDNWGCPAEPRPGKFVSLHQRIENWHSLYGASGVMQSLMAIKWLGNVGSHETRIARERLLDAYEILSRVLKQLFPPDERYLDDLAAEIVKSKGLPDS